MTLKGSGGLFICRLSGSMLRTRVIIWRPWWWPIILKRQSLETIASSLKTTRQSMLVSTVRPKIIPIWRSRYKNFVRATLPPSTLFADRALHHRGYSISVPNTWGETVSKPLGLTLGLVYNPSRLQLTRWSLHSIAKREWHRHRCQP